MSGRQPLPPPQPPKPTRLPFKGHQGKRKRPADDNDDDRNNVNGFRPRAGGPAGGSRPAGDRRPPRPKKQKKAKTDSGEGRGEAGVLNGETKTKIKTKKPKNNKNAVDEADLDYNLGLNRAVARMDATAAATYLAGQTKRYGSDLSEVELADLSIDAAAFVDTSAYAHDRTLDNLADYLETMTPMTEDGKGKKARQTLQAAPAVKGAPHTIVVTGAGQRAADLVRAVRPFQTKTNAVSKLFAKHIKLAEAVSFLATHRTGIAVGTPARLIDLLDHGSLSVAHLRRIVVDVSHIDQKKRGVLDMQDTALPVARWLARPELQARYGGAGEGDEGGEGGDAKDKDGANLAKPISILFY